MRRDSRAREDFYAGVLKPLALAIPPHASRMLKSQNGALMQTLQACVGQRRCLCTPRMGQAVPWNTSPKASRPAHPACTFYASLLADEKRERNCVALEAVSSRPEIQCRGKARRLLFRPGRDLQIRARVRDVLHQFLGARRQPPSSSRRKASSAGMVCNSLR